MPTFTLTQVRTFYDFDAKSHRRMSQRCWGEGGCSPFDLGKANIFRAKAKFFGQKPAAKKKKQIFFLYLLNEKNGTHSI